MWAANNGHLATVRLLVLAGAEVTRKNVDCQMAEDIAYSSEHLNVSIRHVGSMVCYVCKGLL